MREPGNDRQRELLVHSLTHSLTRPTCLSFHCAPDTEGIEIEGKSTKRGWDCSGERAEHPRMQKAAGREPVSVRGSWGGGRGGGCVCCPSRDPRARQSRSLENRVSSRGLSASPCFRFLFSEVPTRASRRAFSAHCLSDSDCPHLAICLGRGGLRSLLGPEALTVRWSSVRNRMQKHLTFDKVTKADDHMNPLPGPVEGT